jgi:hypothetical protein
MTGEPPEIGPGKGLGGRRYGHFSILLSVFGFFRQFC